MAGDDTVGVLDRMIAILEAFDRDDRGLRVLDLAERTGLATSTVSRVVAGLVAGSYLERDGSLIRLGLRLFELAQVAVEPRRIRAAAVPVMLRVRHETRASLQLTVLEGAETLILVALRGHGPESEGAVVGERHPLSATASGRAMRDRTRVIVEVAGVATIAVPIDAPGTPPLALALIGGTQNALLQRAAELIRERLRPV